MESELARAKAEAEAAKKQAEAQTAAATDARRSLEVQLAAEAKARAEAELAGARAEAESIKRDAQAQALAATRAREQAEASAAQAKSLAEEAAAKAAASAESRHDGTWVALHACEATRRAPEVKSRFPADISAGTVRVRNGRPGENGYVSFEGRIAADGSLALSGVLIPGRDELGREEHTVHYEGRLEGDRFILTGEVGRRPCTLALSRLGN